MSSEKPKIIYLDQKGWIDLAKSNKETIFFIENLSESGKGIFPLSIVHLQETSKIRDNRRKQELSKLMVRVSKGYCFLPYVDQVIEEEIRLEILQLYGCQKVDLGDYVLKKGICHMIGVKPTVVKKEGSEVPGDEPPADVKKKMLDYIETPEAMLGAFLVHPLYPKITQMYKDAVEKMEENRKKQLKIKNKNLRSKIIFGDFMIDLIGPMVARVLIGLNISKNSAFFNDWGREEYEQFIDRIPTALCLFTLLLKRDQQLNRPIQVNDIPDVWALSLAIPYSNVVVTENMWTSIAMQETKLALKCNTRIFTTINELIQALRDEK